MKLSIIVPVYKVEEYLPQCLESCLRQDLSSIEYEIVVVNDGSPDNSSRIIDEYSQNFSNIVVVDKENGGLSSARNAGMRIAKGEYLWFVDSDDWIEEGCLETLREELAADADIITLNAILHVGGTEKKVIRNLSSSEICEGRYVYRKSYVFPYSGAQFFIFRRDFLLSHNLFFKEGIYYEDLLFTSEVLSVAKVCVTHEVPCYHYRIRKNSITTSEISERKIRDMFAVMDAQYSWVRTCPTASIEVMADAICKTANGIIRDFILRIPSEARRQWYGELRMRKYWGACVKKAKGYKNWVYYAWVHSMAIF